MYQEEAIINRVTKQYIKIEVDEGNINQRVVRGLSIMMLEIWNDWREDTRHYQPSQEKQNFYISTVDRGERKLDPELPDYELAKTVIKDCRKFILHVVTYRVRRKPRVF
ncbi:MAG: hypothetical protein LIO94_02290 [Clostridiales bacterium]|nr:hypothetical protein [Clostridiales bacterium]